MGVINNACLDEDKDQFRVLALNKKKEMVLTTYKMNN